MFKTRIAAASAVALCLAAPARAAVIEYTAQAAFDAATQGVVTYAIPKPASGQEQALSSPYAIGPLAFTSDGTLYLENDGFYGAKQTYLQASLVQTESVAGAGSTAVSFRIGTTTRGESLAIDINGALVAILKTGVAGTSKFIGFTSTDAIDTISFTDTLGTDGDTDVLRFQVGSAIPEPAPMLVGAVMGAGLLASRRRAR
jgi:hypothetical protein